MNERLLPYARIAIILLLLAGLAGVPAYGWWPLAAMVIAGAGNEGLQRALPRLRGPEVALVILIVAAQALLAVGLAAGHGPRLFLLSTLTFPLLFAAAVFPARTVFLLTVLSLLLLLGLAFGFEAPTVWHLPPVLLCAAVNLITLPLIMEAACTLDAESRSTVVIDNLTGLLNRGALPPRLTELAHHMEMTGQPVAVIVGDLDRFKTINDQYGHATGDLVLKEVAYSLRETLGPFKPIYRLGGEEFLILLADQTAAAAVEVAEQLRAAVPLARTPGVAPTMSFGVADSAPGESFDFDALFARADAALYEAKRSGRNRVCVAVQPSRATISKASAPSEHSASGVPAARIQTEPPPRSGASPGNLLVGALHTSAPEEGLSADRSWLIPDAISRSHLLDLTERLTRRAAGGYALGFISVLIAAPYYGWLILLPGFVTGAMFTVTISKLKRFRRPEYALGVGALLAQAGGACGLLVAHGEILFDLPVLLALLVGVSVLLPARGVLIGVIFTAAGMSAVAFAHDAHHVLENPSLLALPVSLAATVGLIGRGVGRSDTEHRGLATVDSLTGMLNRAALEAQLVAVTHEANMTDAPVAVAVGDLDHFKRINDLHGHATGDAVLGAVAARIRSQLRVFESAYRIGGEEFVVLIPGALAEDAAAIAERIRKTLANHPIEGIPVTLSIGVAASTPGEAFDYDIVFAAADAALYTAKREGRNRVERHTPLPAGPDRETVRT